ncbi:hypothetical protein HYX11_03100 [Candidatus Woesearchaeota archaeon]|nr:hypothetical protein [Candidatus Woesearchaeota archaeon]
MNSKIIPSVMAKNQKELDQDLKKIRSVTKRVHLDIADGKFVNNTLMGFKFKLPKNFQYSAHLMLEHPQPWIKNHLKQIDLFIPQLETIKNIKKHIAWIKSHKKKVAFALKPYTAITRLKPFLKDIDYLLILTVHPGFYGSLFLPSALRKISVLKKHNSKIKIIVDGGMNPQTIKQTKQYTIDYYISGSYTTKAEFPQKSISNLLNALK